MKLGTKELEYLKKNLTTEDLLEIVSLKAKLNKKARTGTINEHLVESQQDWTQGFQKFVNEYLDEQEQNQIKIIFSKLSHDVVNQRFLQTVYSCISDMIKQVDQELIDSAN